MYLREGACPQHSFWSTLMIYLNYSVLECWTITSDIEKKIEAAEMWFIRRMLRISWTEKKPNVNVLREGNVQRSLLKTIRKRLMEFLGHVCIRRGLEFLSLTGKVEGKRDRGKWRITFLDSLCNSATGGQSKGLNFLKLSDDRDAWRGMAANVCSKSGTWWWWWFSPYIHRALHADDLAIWTSAETIGTAQTSMQDAISKVEQWAKDWGVTIDESKTA